MIKLKSWLISAWKAKVSVSPMCTSAIFFPTRLKNSKRSKRNRAKRKRANTTAFAVCWRSRSTNWIDDFYWKTQDSASTWRWERTVRAGIFIGELRGSGSFFSQRIRIISNQCLECFGVDFRGGLDSSSSFDFPFEIPFWHSRLFVLRCRISRISFWWNCLRYFSHPI